MTETERDDSGSPTPSGMLDEARAVYEQMAGDARDRIEREHRETVRRSPIVKILLALTITSVLLSVVIGIYGAYRFPDAPIRQTEKGYAGKLGAPHTLEDYETFLLWEKTMFVVFPAAFIFGFALVAKNAMERRRRTSNGS